MLGDLRVNGSEFRKKQSDEFGERHVSPCMTFIAIAGIILYVVGWVYWLT